MILITIYLIGFGLTKFIMNNNEELYSPSPNLASVLWFIFWPVAGLLMLNLGEDE